ncbi:hypothetical protein G7Y89_g10597 [Cudoniella acicularis]|uniref:BTB domain-containing protein n=1 Tax=Cudoniella acicularis TaxID=354080 RepID=A0A8H4RES1_9HELO|nr:hypothetical protein G7Y89_g10597 [Cudoniella acicularis]
MSTSHRPRALHESDGNPKASRRLESMPFPRIDTIVQSARLRPRNLLLLQGMPHSSPGRSRIIVRSLMPEMNSNLTSSIITLVVGREQRLFAAHEDVLCISPFFSAVCRGQFMEAASKRITLPDEEPEIFSSVLEYLYKGDYYLRLVQNKRKNSWELESGEEGGSIESTVFHHGVDGELLKDTVIYCTAEKYSLEGLKRVALRKQGLQSGIQCSTILSSARYAYANTPDTDSKLRAH